MKNEDARAAEGALFDALERYKRSVIAVKVCTREHAKRVAEAEETRARVVIAECERRNARNALDKLVENADAAEELADFVRERAAA